MSNEEQSGKEPAYRLPPTGAWANAWKVSAGCAAVGFASCWLFYDGHRFGFSWLFAFMCFLAIALGSLFFVLVQHLTSAAWSVTARRIAEFMLCGLPVFALLFVPVAMHMGELYPWMEHHGDASHEEGHGEGAHAEEGEAHSETFFSASSARAQEHEHGHGAGGHGDSGEAAHGEGGHHDSPEHALHAAILEAKAPYLNQPFFLVRAGVYFLLWLLLTVTFVRTSLRQDREKSKQLTLKMEGWAPVATVIFGLSLTFAAFDWMMSLEPAWFSTIYGVQYFAVSVVSSYAILITLALGLRKAGYIGNALNVEHFHDLGKLQFGFLVFWAYISVSQFLLIWYAGIPEEATYYHLRWWHVDMLEHVGGGFLTLSLIVLVGHFILPFFFLISRNAKRNLPFLRFCVAWILVMHVLEIYWLVMPYAGQTGLVETSLHFHPLDVASLLAVGGTYFAVVFWQMGRHPLVPIGDPRLARALHHEVV